MKKAEDYLKKANEFYRCNIRMEDVYVNEEAALKAIKQAQIDAVDATVLKCSQEANVKWCGEFIEIPVNTVIVDKDSILQVAEQLKKELE